MQFISSNYSEVSSAVIARLNAISRKAQQNSLISASHLVAEETTDFMKQIQEIRESKKSESKKQKKLDQVALEIKERMEYYKRSKIGCSGLSSLYAVLKPVAKKSPEINLVAEKELVSVIEPELPAVRQITDSVSVQTDANGEETLCVEIDLDKEGLRYDQVMARHAAEQSRAADIVDAEVINAAPETIFPYQEYLATGLSLMDEPAKSKNYFRKIVEEYRSKAQMHWADWVEDKVQAAEAAQQVQAIRDELQAFQKEAEAMNLNTKIWRTELNFRFMDDLLSALKQGSKQFVNTKAARNPAMADAMQRAGIKKV